jgi:hypothetical protein
LSSSSRVSVFQVSDRQLLSLSEGVSPLAADFAETFIKFCDDASKIEIRTPQSKDMTRFLGLVVSIWLLLIAPAQASLCRQMNQQTFCVVNIQRSAKYHWQYWVKTSIDGVNQAKSTFDCRTQKIYTRDGRVTQFAQNSLGALVCKLSS